jgi:hexosaminidase
VIYNQGKDNIYFENSLNCDFVGLNSNLAVQMEELAKAYHNLSISTFSDGPRIVFKKLVNVIQDSYTIQVSDNIMISYSSDASCFYAMNSLMQLIQSNGNQFIINKCYVKDYPRFSWRGLHLDVARHFFTVDEVKRYIDLMSIYKFNVFHWHLTDDQGWRIEIKQYPKLTEVGAWRDSTLNNHYSTNPRTYLKERYGGFYTQDQVREIVAYAQSKYITIVPEIEMPGHSRAALAAYPEYSCTGKQLGVESLWGVFDDIFCSKPETITFLKNILDEVMLLFPGEYIHIGGDEAPKARWKKCTKCQDVIKNNNLKDEHQLQSYFIQQMDAYLTKKGKKIIGWDEILEGGLSSNAAVMSWRGFEGGIQAANQEHYVVMSPGSHCYFDHYQSKSKDEPLAIGGFTPLEKVYNFNPIPKELKENYHPYILGGQANLWTEYISNFKQVEYMVYPRAIALSQALWSIEKIDFKVFKSILMNNHIKYLQNRNVNFSKAAFAPEIEWNKTNKGLKFKINTSTKSDAVEIAYTQLEYIKNKSQSKLESGNINLATNQWMEVNRSNNGIIKNIFSIRTEEGIPASNFTVFSSYSLGLPVKFITEPSPNYNSGELTLVDGQTGSLPWKGNEWIGFDTNVIEFEIDLLKKQKYSSAIISFLSEESSWIHFPNEIYLTIDGKTKISNFTILDESNKQVKKIEFPLPFHCQRVKFTIISLKNIPDGLPGEGNIPWTFVDEIQVIR